MVWERRKIIISKAPAEPSLMLWLITGVIAVVAGVLLFLLHAGQLLGPFQIYDIRVLSTTPLLTWIFLMSLRAGLYNVMFNRHRFEFNEAIDTQQRWTDWAGRYLAVLHSTVLLPGKLTAAQFIQPPPGLELYGGQTRRVSWDEAESLLILLGDVSDALLQLPPELPLNITLLTDSPTDPLVLQRLFARSWKETITAKHPIPNLNILQSYSLLALDERIKLSIISAELILVQQLHGGEKYSDALAVLLLVSDDVETLYRLNHDVRFLRPMGLNKIRLPEELALFFSTQTQANSTRFIVGDCLSWADDFIELLNARESGGEPWKTEQLYWLENYSGMCGPFSPWITAAVASDMVSLQQASGLMLANDNEQSFITTVTANSQAKK
ncbi:hypothetical protein [Klebsiella sp. BIGb0407]|uniref:hypothetical protein n=1 Tax=Klebsiella sp. BIGb0407 TaxID=2940603 RepID=UPI0021681C51|nr:hypothetical protein [Klebsiella sp. BIGb0407]MCS3433649.1 hypothetical protein [Klebsiella sp. BIGb0407]